MGGNIVEEGRETFISNQRTETEISNKREKIEREIKRERKREIDR